MCVLEVIGIEARRPAIATWALAAVAAGGLALGREGGWKGYPDQDN